jgi:hypothetical protein
MLRPSILLLGGLLMFGCNEFQQAVKEAKNEVPPPPKDNYIVLLDLSDRILANNQQQVAKDLTVIRNIFGLFKSNLNKKDPSHLYYGLNDKLKILIAPQRTTPGKLYEESGLLRVDISAELPEKKSKLVHESEKSFNSILPDVYKQALVSKHSSGYAGADIWKYFNEDLGDDLDKDAQNTLFIITDGYMDFEKSEDRPAVNNRYSSCAQIINNLKTYPDWNLRFDKGDYGLIPVAKKFPGLRIVLVQMSPGQDWTGEYPLLTRIWGKWFKEMDVQTFAFIKNENIGEVKESIEKFLQIKLNTKVEPASWTAIELSDSTGGLSSARLAAKGKEANTGMTAMGSTKKKDEFKLNDSSQANQRLAAQSLNLKRSIKQKEQVSFGPAY